MALSRVRGWNLPWKPWTERIFAATTPSKTHHSQLVSSNVFETRYKSTLASGITLTQILHQRNFPITYIWCLLHLLSQYQLPTLQSSLMNCFHSTGCHATISAPHMVHICLNTSIYVAHKFMHNSTSLPTMKNHKNTEHYLILCNPWWLR